MWFLLLQFASWVSAHSQQVLTSGGSSLRLADSYFCWLYPSSPGCEIIFLIIKQIYIVTVRNPQFNHCHLTHGSDNRSDHRIRINNLSPFIFGIWHNRIRLLIVKQFEHSNFWRHIFIFKFNIDNSLHSFRKGTYWSLWQTIPTT